MLARALTFTIDGVAPRLLCVEVDVRAGLPSTTFIGLGDAVVREARESVRCALANIGFVYPQQRVSAPASLRGPLAGLRLAAAVGVLAASGQLDPRLLADSAVYGQIAPSGGIMSLPGSVAVARACARHGIRRLLVPAADAALAAALADNDDLEILGVLDLADLARVIAGGPPTPARPQACRAVEVEHPDLAEVRVEPSVVFALQLAAAGGHHLLLEGPSGSGHTMLARRLPGIMAPLSRPHALEVAELHDIAGLARQLGERPMRAPHHTISLAGLLGGGSPVRPGEATLAHHGVLYLHELESFQSCALQALGIAAREREVVLVRGERAVRLPASFTLLGSLCIEEPEDRGRVRRRIAPIRPSFDLRVYTPRLTPADQETQPAVDSATVRARVLAARSRQAERGQTVPNADLAFDTIASRCTPRAAAMIHRAYELGVGSHGRARLARVAQSVADLYSAWPDGRVDEHAIREALPFTGCPGVL
jgi:magnesium chelatase family protein